MTPLRSLYYNGTPTIIGGGKNNGAKTPILSDYDASAPKYMAFLRPEPTSLSVQYIFYENFLLFSIIKNPHSGGFFKNLRLRFLLHHLIQQRSSLFLLVFPKYLRFYQMRHLNQFYAILQILEPCVPMRAYINVAPKTA